MDRPPIEISEKPISDVREVPLREIVLQHRMRYRLRLSVGDMVFRHIGRLERDSVYARLCAEHPEYEDLRVEFIELGQKAAMEGLGAQDLKRYRALDRQLFPFSLEYSLACIVTPEILTVEELDALLTTMKPREADAVLELLAQLNGPRDIMLSPEGILLIQELKVPLPADLTLETLTAEQAHAMLAGSAEMGKQAMGAIKEAIKHRG